jgi:hypothetical protein
METMTAKWRYTLTTQEADHELASFLADRTIAPRLRTQMQRLAKEDDPRWPVAEGLDVMLLDKDCPTWYRLKIADIDVRLIFSLWNRWQGKSREYQPGQNLWPDGDHLINIEQVSYRTHATYREAARRWRKSHGK